MRTRPKSRSLIYETLDLALPALPTCQVPQKRPKSLLSKLWQFLIDALTPQYEPIIRLTTDRVGNTWWLIHDPISGKTKCMNSENEVLIWLDHDRFQRPH